MGYVVAGGGVVLRKQKDELQVLLIYRNGVWDLPKGKKEKGENIEDCARREVSEETGISLPRIKRFLTKTYHEYEQNSKYFKKETHWFEMKTEEDATLIPQKEEGITVIEWTEIGKAKKKVGYRNLHSVLNKINNLPS